MVRSRGQAVIKMDDAGKGGSRRAGGRIFRNAHFWREQACMEGAVVGPGFPAIDIGIVVIVLAEACFLVLAGLASSFLAANPDLDASSVSQLQPRGYMLIAFVLAPLLALTLTIFDISKKS